MEKIRIAFFDAKDYDRDSFDQAADRERFDIRYYETRLTKETCALADGCQAVCVFVNDDVDAGVIGELEKRGVRLVALRCAGYNNVDIQQAYGRIHVVRVPAYSPYAVAEHAMALLLTSIRRIHKAYIRTRDFNFSLSGMTGFDLNGKTVGVVGTGKIGRVFIQICRGFGMKVIAYDKFPAPDSGIEYVTLDELWQRSDIISFHCPLTDENRHMVNADTIARMKKGVVLINTSRGGLIDSEALVEGIKSRQIGAACLDVYEEEANVFFHDYSGHIVDDDTLARLISMPNVILTSHQAFLTKEALGNIAQTTLKNIEDFLQNGMSPNEICYKCPKVAQCDQKHGEKCF
ncbi:MAG: 2-hydroxyacid dehydrogenase [Clostridia bacterium]|nr:2-hydroxyacid dehydrogenase [Clostridia bacterium]